MKKVSWIFMPVMVLGFHGMGLAQVETETDSYSAEKERTRENMAVKAKSEK